MKNIYSPRQIQVATFLGGPLAAAYFLKRSFESIGKTALANKCFLICLIGGVIILGILPFLPEETPNTLIPIAYLIPVIALLKKDYLTKQEITESEVYKFESNWKVFGISLGATLVYAILAFGVVWFTQSDDDVAQYLVENVNNSDIELNENYFIKLEALKDPNGSGAFLNFTLNNDVINDFKNANQDELRSIAVSFIGNDYLIDLAENNVYIIVNFQTISNEIVNKVKLSPPNIKSN